MNINNPYVGRAARAVAFTVVPLALVGSVVAARFASTGHSGYSVPHSAGLETNEGIRVSSAKVVGDNGLVEIDYVVLDADKASRFQNDVKNPPRIGDDKHRKNGLVWRAALMKQGHTLRAGQTYYIIYQNQQNTVHRGDKVSISYGGTTLDSVPVR